MDYRDDAYAQYLAEMALRKRQQDLQNAAPPVGIGPVSDAELYGAMLNRGADIPWNESQQVNRGGAIPRDNGQPMQTELQDTPIDELVGRMTPSVGADGEVVPAGMDVAATLGQNGNLNDTLLEMGRIRGKREKPMTLRDTGILPAGKPTGEAPPIIEDIKKEVGPAAGEVATQQKPTEEQVAAVTELAKEKIVIDPNTTPQEKQDKMNQLDSNPGIAQKLAMIAMAVAPTMVGYAMAGKKGAFLGAAATGKGLETGAKAYQDEQEAKMKYAKEKEKEQADNWIVAGPDRTGNVVLVNKKTSQAKTVPVEGTGETFKRSNEGGWTIDPATQTPVFKKPFESTDEQYASNLTPISVVKSDLAQQISNIRKIKGNETFNPNIRANVADFMNKYPNHSLDSSTPPIDASGNPVMDQKTYTDIRRQAQIDIANAYKQINSAGKTKAERASESWLDKKIIASQMKNLSDFKKADFDPYMKELEDMRPFINGDFDTNNVANAALYMKAIKKIQGDQSVIRESDLRTLEAFLNIGTKLGQIESIINNKGRMSEDLKKDIMQMMVTYENFKRKQIAMRVNEYAAQSKSTGVSAEQAFELGGDAGMLREAKNFGNFGLSKAPAIEGVFNQSNGKATPQLMNNILGLIKEQKLGVSGFVKDQRGVPVYFEIIKNKSTGNKPNLVVREWHL